MLRLESRILNNDKNPNPTLQKNKLSVSISINCLAIERLKKGSV
jgi:hypothetical protein